MKTAILIIITLACGSSAELRAQIKATTEDGKNVLLFEDGTWEYLDLPGNGSGVPGAASSYSKPNSSKQRVSGSNVPYVIWYDDSKWTQLDQNHSTSADFTFKLDGEDAYGMIIAERLQIPEQTLMEVAVENASAVGENIAVVKREKRFVNGLDVNMMQYGGTIRGIPFIYYGYFYSFDGGSIQFVTYTGENLFEEYETDLTAMLNGLVIEGDE